jgi:hypothetical protein
VREAINALFQIALFVGIFMTVSSCIVRGMG